MKLSMTGRWVGLENVKRVRLTRRKVVFALLLAMIAIPDVIFHSLFYVVHIGFEWLEYGIEEFCQHFLHASRHQSQIITFYLLLTIGLFIGYRLYRAFPRLYRRTRDYLIAIWAHETAEAEVYWQGLTPKERVKVTFTLAAGIACLGFWLFN